MRAPLLGSALFVTAVVAAAAWQHGLWGTAAGCALVAAWLLVLLRVSPAGPTPARARSTASPDSEDIPLRVLLDQIPIPLVAVEGDAPRALNRPARALFATDERILPAPAALAADDASHLVHEGRRYRIDRIAAGGVARRRAIIALIDVEAEERTAQARAAADMIQVLGHEMLNGLAPIVSLAESGAAVLSSPDRDDALLAEILGTLARRADGLLRFTEAYRAISRLPDPTRTPVDPAVLAGDLDRLFASRWGDDIAFAIRVEAVDAVLIDRDQATQAIWALLQNAGEAAIRADRPPSVDVAIRHETGRLSVTVADSGNGVGAADVDRVFRLFHTTKPSGSGVGLNLARQIAQAHGGDVRLTIRSPTTFRLDMAC